MSMALVNPVEAFADRIYDYLATNEQFLRWGSRECVVEAFRLVFGGDYGATEEAAEVLRGVAEGALLPRFVLVADSPYAATWVVAERRWKEIPNPKEHRHELRGRHRQPDRDYPRCRHRLRQA